MFDFLKDTNFLNAFNSEEHFYFKNVNLPLLTWDAFIDQIDKAINNNDPIRYSNNYGINLFQMYESDLVDNFLKEYSKLNNKFTSSAHIYMSLSTLSEGLGRHNDPSDVLYWQVIGKTLWVVEDKIQKTYVLEPNDAIYIPYRMWHTVIPLTPRVGISLGIDKSE